ncbi:MAG TPA: NADH-quinone oxidoreductase subunit C [Bacillota bacterium]|nr:NADH-quinone oxidoreductase subunit C [Bacillota bacterium]
MVLLYHVALGVQMRHLGLRQNGGVAFPSVSGVLPGAWLYENEIQDQFEVTFAGLTPDYGGKLFLRRDVSGTPWGAPRG